MRNPEKYAEKPESEMSYDERRKKRMNDPEERNQLTCIQEVHG